MSQSSPTTEGWWSWQWSITFAVMFGYFVGAMLWISGFQIIAALVGISATLLGIYILSSG
jgi:Ca2+/Na+ antiporter